MKNKKYLILGLSLLMLSILCGIVMASPTVTQVSPVNGVVTNTSMQVRCSFVADFQNKTITNVTFYSDVSGTMALNFSVTSGIINNTQYNMTNVWGNYSDATYNWKCGACSNGTTVSQCANTSTRTIIVDDTSPTISKYIPTKRSGDKVTLEITTNDVSSTCKLDEIAATDYDDMSTAFSSTGITPQLILEFNQTTKTHTWYVACVDTYNNPTPPSTITIDKTVPGSVTLPVILGAVAEIEEQTEQGAGFFDQQTIVQGIDNSLLVVLSIVAICIIVFVLLIIKLGKK